MDEKAVQIVMDKLELLASKIGVTGEYMFGIYVKQASVAMVSFVVFSCILGLLLVLTFWAIKVSIIKDAWSCDEINSINLLAIASGGLSIGLLVLFFVKLNDFFSCFLNPEYYALNQLLSVLN